MKLLMHNCSVCSDARRRTVRAQYRWLANDPFSMEIQSPRAGHQPSRANPTSTGPGYSSGKSSCPPASTNLVSDRSLRCLPGQ